MKESTRLPILIIFSLLLHIGILSVLPVINFNRVDEEKVYEVKLIKPKPQKPAASKKVRAVKKTNKKVNKQPKIKKEVPKKKIDYASFKKPNIVLPSINNEEKINVPDSIVDNQNNNLNGENLSPSANVNNELSKASKSFNNNKNLNKKGVKGSIYSNSDFFEIKNLSDNQRRLLNKPKPPKYSLENDSKIVLKFYIDKYGKPTKITYVTRSDSKVEKLAMDYVNKLRFGAVDYDTLDAVQITLYFKVK
jgi:outer membrane biosynthesis protein TonB